MLLPRRRHAFSLVELLVVVFIISVLIALLLPAVQRVRDSAARAQCSNNLRQLGLALHHYHNVARVFPPGMRWQKGKDPMPASSWLTQILPYVEQQPLWLVTQDAYRQSPSPFKNPPHGGLGTVIALFVCPADGRGSAAQLAQREKLMVALTSYLGVEGKDVTTNDGILFRDSHVRTTDVTDGLSNTLLVGERPASPDFQFGWWYAGAGQSFTGSCDMVLGVQEQNLSPTMTGACPPGAYRFAPGKFDNPCDMYHFWSPHPGGAQFLLADGSVRFLVYAAAPLMPALASRAGSEAASNLD
jgi:prepilin-type N-terminal cleavage/methylation domain-containing protein/prepilin-type processing-associated H-X9-DG protein